MDMVPVVKQAAEQGDPLAEIVFAQYEARGPECSPRTSPPPRLWPRPAMDKTLAARRLSAALGMKIEPEIIDVVYEPSIVRLKNGRAFSLAGGNAAYYSSYDENGSYVGFWVKNGKVWDIQPDEDVRPLPEASTK
jgi:hypothetical protein